MLRFLESRSVEQENVLLFGSWVEEVARHEAQLTRFAEPTTFRGKCFGAFFAIFTLCLLGAFGGNHAE
jgi:hypothetical protein